MDIAKLSMAMSSMNVMNELSMRVMKMALDQTKDVGDLLASISDVPANLSLDPTIGQLLDISM